MAERNLGLENPVILPLDVRNWRDAQNLVGKFHDLVGAFKIGAKTFSNLQDREIAYLAGQMKGVMVDRKSSDIPASTVGAVEGDILAFQPRILTVHIGSGPATLKAVVEAAKGTNTLVTGITVLTSISNEDCIRMHGRPVLDQVVEYATIAAECNVPAIVCSPLELQTLRPMFPDMFMVTPGIRDKNAPPDDQARKATPKEAGAWGADAIVVGRPITQAESPIQKFNQILTEFLVGKQQ